MTDKALRYNEGKAPLSYVTSAKYALEGVAQVFAFGANKYARDNWKKGLDVNETIDSLLRHLSSYQDGETHDPESGCHHLDHVLANAIFLSHHHNGRKPVETKSSTLLNKTEAMYPGEACKSIDWNEITWTNPLTVKTRGEKS